MDSKKNQILLGIIILIFGISILIGPSISVVFQFGSLLLITSGFSLVLLYKTKRKNWSLVFGVYALYFGIASFLRPFIGSDAILNIIGSMFFVVPAIIFIVLYADKNRQGLLLPACLMLCFGIYLFIMDLTFINWLDRIGLLFICLGIAFITAYHFGRLFIGRWAYIVGGFLLLFGAFRILKVNSPISSLISVFGDSKQIVAIILILISVYIIIQAIRKK